MIYRQKFSLLHLLRRFTTRFQHNGQELTNSGSLLLDNESSISSADELLRKYAAGERNFRRANLRGAELEYADLSAADLREANLSAADLGGADLSAADLGGADLSAANLSAVNLEGANLEGANLKGAYYDDKTRFPKDVNLASRGIRQHHPISLPDETASFIIPEKPSKPS